ncbi:tyrosine-protein phosphatase [Peredibacter starrii]|uniref:Tyrosine-protein phosphatase n=1 Tax=Peredibacter starrii TaxID=28202 RepID=A0AAX4HSZ8_9BACT|nr:tyrosine-protein phosphatase [Peredibacter starrii]WPU66454.1 tyrosine-protein phosphatase [Peredibacter starrii]
MKTFILSLLILSTNAFALEGLSIPNSFQVDRHGHVFRGKEPKSAVEELAHFGISDVIIYKNEVKDEVQKEILALNSLGINAYHIPFRWKEYESMELACEQTVEALNLIYRIKAKGGRVFFHCTAGEDRTGMLAGLYRMLEERIPGKVAFQYEMCARGYSDGNGRKPPLVTGAIQKELTPLFITLAQKIENREWKLGHIPKRSCQGLVVYPTKLQCRNK